MAYRIPWVRMRCQILVAKLDAKTPRTTSGSPMAMPRRASIGHRWKATNTGGAPRYSNPWNIIIRPIDGEQADDAYRARCSNSGDTGGISREGRVRRVIVL